MYRSGIKRSLLNTSADPYWNQVAILLHCDSALDSSRFRNAVTTTGVTYQSTTAVFNNSAQYTVTSGAFQRVVYNRAMYIGTSDFTIEGWFRKNVHTSPAGNQTFFQTGTAGSNGIGVYLSTAGGLDFVGFSTYYCGISANSISLDTWYHLAIVRHANVAAIYLNGQLASNTGPGVSSGPAKTWACTTNITTATAALVGGASYENRNINGYIDEFRLTVGVARYLSNFSVPIRPFPTHL